MEAHKYGDLEKFSKLAQTYFEIVKDKEVNMTRYMIVKLGGTRKWRFAGFKKVKGETVRCTITTREINLEELI
jgi:hypothetical protein